MVVLDTSLFARDDALIRASPMNRIVCKDVFAASKVHGLALTLCIGGRPVDMVKIERVRAMSNSKLENV